jgi:hypothetical protein
MMTRETSGTSAYCRTRSEGYEMDHWRVCVGEFFCLEKGHTLISGTPGI